LTWCEDGCKVIGLSFVVVDVISVSWLEWFVKSNSVIFCPLIASGG